MNMRIKLKKVSRNHYFVISLSVCFFWTKVGLVLKIVWSSTCLSCVIFPHMEDKNTAPFPQYGTTLHNALPATTLMIRMFILIYRHFFNAICRWYLPCCTKYWSLSGLCAERYQRVVELASQWYRFWWMAAWFCKVILFFLSLLSILKVWDNFFTY